MVEDKTIICQQLLCAIELYAADGRTLSNEAHPSIFGKTLETTIQIFAIW